MHKRRNLEYTKARGIVQLKYDSTGLQKLNELEEFFSLQEIINLRKRAEREMRNELRKLQEERQVEILKKGKIQSQSNSTGNDGSYVGWISSWWNGDSNKDIIENNDVEGVAGEGFFDNGSDSTFKISNDEKMISKDI